MAAWRVRAFVLAAALSAGACSQRPEPPLLPPASLTAAQTEALRRMNEAGTTAFEGVTWRYALGAGCVLRIRRSHEGRVQDVADHSMTERSIEVVPYPAGSFGVKAYAAVKGGSVDLFDTASGREADAFARHARQLIAPCAGSRPAMPRLIG